MWKKIAEQLRSIGRHAMGYLRSINGHTAAGAAKSYLATFSPAVSEAISPFANKLGEYINQTLDNYAGNSRSAKMGINKPKWRSRVRFNT